MNRITDLTKVQIAQLSEDDLKQYLQVELMHEGIVVPPPLPAPPEKKDIPKTVEVFHIKGDWGVICTLPTAELAQAVLSASNGAFLNERYIYEVGYDKKFGEGTDKCSIVPEMFYAEHELRNAAKELIAYASAKKAYEDDRRAHEKAMERYNQTASRIRSIHYEATDAAQDASAIHRTFKDYVKMTNGDQAMALTFLLKVYNQDQIADANEFLADENKIPLPAKSMPENS